ncbi:DUF3152 domain-containing protein [Amycolatopsis acidicola]|uniref:DUF3152 domain-containing protein n=1 Tax=Amycolatopsis acidicola TaxID=2596893 RepID=UPI001FB7123B|nr:DUF3152 domain-containing protein [Amycolatopsis acidicola]
MTNGAENEARPRRSADPGEERYRPGRRRTSAEPLSASWKPARPGQLEQDAKQAREARRSRGKVKRITKAYGWRVYALPILVVITALVLFNTVNSGPQQATNASSQSEDGSDSGPAEQPAAPVNLNIPTAPLPDGIAFTQSGTGTYHVVPLAKDGTSGKKVGNGPKMYHYTVEVENGIDPSSYAGDDAWAATVEATLSSPQSWIGTGKVSLQRVDASYPDPDFRVSLTTPDTDKRADVCGFDIEFPTSCYTRSFDHRVVINLARWVRGALAFGSDMVTYRQYAINHEVGHALGNGHVGCQENGALAPVMMQQTFGVNNDYVAQLNSVDQYNKNAVAADHKVCKPNAWPVLNQGDTPPGG